MESREGKRLGLAHAWVLLEKRLCHVSKLSMVQSHPAEEEKGERVRPRLKGRPNDGQGRSAVECVTREEGEETLPKSQERAKTNSFSA